MATLTWMLVAMLVAVPMQPIAGSATHYDSGHVMRNGQKLDLNAPTCSVDDKVFEQLVGKALVVCNAANHCILCNISDSGYLDGDEDVFFIDLTPAAFRELRRELTAEQDNDGRLPVTIFVIP